MLIIHLIIIGWAVVCAAVYALTSSTKRIERKFERELELKERYHNL